MYFLNNPNHNKEQSEENHIIKNFSNSFNVTEIFFNSIEKQING